MSTGTLPRRLVRGPRRLDTSGPGAVQDGHTLLDVPVEEPKSDVSTVVGAVAVTHHLGVGLNTRERREVPCLSVSDSYT